MSNSHCLSPVDNSAKNIVPMLLVQWLLTRQTQMNEHSSLQVRNILASLITNFRQDITNFKCYSFTLLNTVMISRNRHAALTEFVVFDYFSSTSNRPSTNSTKLLIIDSTINFERLPTAGYVPCGFRYVNEKYSSY